MFKRVTRGFITLAVVACAALPVEASETVAAASVSVQTGRHVDAAALGRQTDALARRIVREVGVTGMAVSLVYRGEVVLERGYGVVEARRAEPVTADTVFRLASLSKAFASTLAGKLVEEGALRWDTRATDLLPAFKLANPQVAEQVTLENILSHRLGLGFHAFDPLLESDEPYPLMIAKLDSAPMLCQAGDCYAYQNVAFSLVGDMAFAVTGDFFTHQVEKKLFHPLGMYTATYGREALEASASWARPHVMRGGRMTAIRAKENYYRVPPAAGVNASARDLTQWLLGNLGHRPEVLSQGLLTNLHQPVVDTPGEIRGIQWRKARIRKAEYALGWRIYNYAGHKMVFHAGAVQGYRGMIAMLPELDIGMAVVWNCECVTPSGLLPTIMDRALALPSQDWLQLDQVRRQR